MADKITQFKPLKMQGFTLIELIVVIIVLAILAVVAASKYVDLKRDAAISDVKATAAAYQQGVTFVHLRWQVSGESGAVNDLEGYIDNILDINPLGYPLGIDKNSPMGSPSNIGKGIQGCLDLWNSLLENPPTVSSSNDGSDYQAYRHEASPSTGDVTQCTYVLRTLGDTQGRLDADMKILYDSNNGTARAIITDL
ncbi:type IV pilin protein [Shewanella sp. UCD-KL21]|uniref:type IV pilin protein n=1 Tax=Shewanella sp. UCD-KL21 TaxID=1917164 RepID=UPI0009713699|nr:prepilin-type N-terminal cleavage/methylation domain-containing protein [Shewanella sp. UCD-KL21]